MGEFVVYHSLPSVTLIINYTILVYCEASATTDHDDLLVVYLGAFGK